MSRGKKDSGLGKNEFLFLERKLQVAIPEINLCSSKTDSNRDQKIIEAQACWATRLFHSCDAIVDPRIDYFTLVSKPITVKAAKCRVTDIIPLAGWKNGVMMFAGLKTDGRVRHSLKASMA
jgi:hypothetical protein